MTNPPAASPDPPKNKSITVLAPAKVNLFLHIIGRRDDGYHLLESLFAFADYGDRITVGAAEDIRFSVTGPFAHICRRAGCDGDKNIVVTAARQLQKLCRVTAGAEIVLEKNLPLSAGLGGGSSDAAATLKALQVLWRVEPDEETLVELALGLGADVPACLIGEPAFVTGIGEHITPVEKFGDLAVVLVNPGRPLSTPQVFKTFAKTERPFSDPLALSPEIMEDIDTLINGTHNDLLGPALGLCHEVGEILGVLQAFEDCRIARMSGSGATCFGLFGDQDSADHAAAVIANLHSKWWVRACRVSAHTPFLVHA